MWLIQKKNVMLFFVSFCQNPFTIDRIVWKAWVTKSLDDNINRALLERKEEIPMKQYRRSF